MKLNCSIIQDRRGAGHLKRLYVLFTWSHNGKAHQKQLSTDIKISPEDLQDILNFISVRDEIKPLRERIQSIIDFGARLDLDEAGENVEAMRSFLEHPDPIKEHPLEKFRDFVKQFISLNKEGYSSSRIQHYRTLVRNIDLFLEQSQVHDIFSLMTRTNQITWFSEFVNFLLHYEQEGIKYKYENATAIQQMNMIKTVASTFMDTGIKISPMQFVKNLRVVKQEAVYLSKSELRTVIEAFNEYGAFTHNKPKTEWKATALFLFQCVTGLRSNELKFKEDAIQNMALTFNSGKKGLVNQIPLGSLACRILNSWQNKKVILGIRSPYALPVMSSTHSNEALHSFLRKLPGFDRIVLRVRYRGIELIEERLELWQAVTTHTGRHTFSHLMTSGGLNLEEAGSLLSHGSVETTKKHYAHLEKETIRDRALKIINEI